MLRIAETSLVGKYNLIDDRKSDSDEDKYVRMLSKEEVRVLGESIMRNL